MQSATKLVVLVLAIFPALLQGFSVNNPLLQKVSSNAMKTEMSLATEGTKLTERLSSFLEDGAAVAKNALAVAALAPLLVAGPVLAGGGADAWSYRENAFEARAGADSNWKCTSCTVNSKGQTVCEGCKAPPKMCGAGSDEPCGPANWEYIYPACAGEEQSPINIVQARPDKALEPLLFTANKPLKAVTLQESEHNWEVKVPDGSKPDNFVEFKGEKYNLLQFHFHTPAEHAIGGGYYDAEMHLVHQNPETKKLLVVGVMYEAGPYPDNAILKRFWGTEPETKFTLGGNSVDLGAKSFSPYNELLPADPAYFNYPGSLTTPGCNEGVTWIVMKQPVRMSEKQFKSMKDGISQAEMSQASAEGYVNRPLQPLYKRQVKLYTP